MKLNIVMTLPSTNILHGESSGQSIPSLFLKHSEAPNCYWMMEGSDLPTAEAHLVSDTVVPETYVIQMPTMPTITNVLDDASGFFVRQKPQYLQNLTSYEFRNKYKVYLKPPEMTGTPRETELKALEPNFYVFDAEETSECCHFL